MTESTDNLYIIESEVPYSKSKLWELQREYYGSKGPAAWRDKEVPYYVTSNPVIAESYADMVIAIARDAAKENPNCEEPLYVLELGAGHGRFGYYFLNAVSKQYEKLYGSNLPQLRYIMSDLSEKNVAAWENNSVFTPFAESGLLDFCLFDLENSDSLLMRRSGKTIDTEHRLTRPLVVIANYILDVIPYELFYLDKGTLRQTMLTLATDNEEWRSADETIWEHLFLQYTYEPMDGIPYTSPPVASVLREYLNTIEQGHLQFPFTALDCIERLSSLSKGGCVVLATDKGSHSSVETHRPGFVPHNASFSNSVNFHAFGRYCAEQGGLALFPSDSRENLVMACFLLTPNGKAYSETAAAYARIESDGNPARRFDEFQAAANGSPVCDAILACLRLGKYDPWLLIGHLDRLYSDFPLDGPSRDAMLAAIPKVWEMRYGAVESFDLALSLGLLCMELGDYVQAIQYLCESPSKDTKETTAKLLLCYYYTGNTDEAVKLL